MLKSVSSKHVVNLYDVVQTPTAIEIYQEYLPSEDLGNKAGKCTVSEFLALSYQLAYGLSDIHKSGICHRDIKLENAKFDEQGVLKIFDFGVSREGDPHLTFHGHGTLEYRAPEVYNLMTASPVQLSFAVDIFSFGVTLHKLAFGDACNFSGYVPKVKFSSPRFSELELGKTITNLLNKTVSIDPNDRPTAEELYTNFRREIARDQHNGFFVTPSHTYIINKSTRSSKLQLQTGLSIVIGYDGYDFIVRDVEGDVYINNNKAKVNDLLHQACVITFDAGSQQRSFVSFSSSHPEIVL